APPASCLAPRPLGPSAPPQIPAPPPPSRPLVWPLGPLGPSVPLGPPGPLLGPAVPRPLGPTSEPGARPLVWPLGPLGPSPPLGPPGPLFGPAAPRPLGPTSKPCARPPVWPFGTYGIASTSPRLSRDATSRLAIRNHLPATECAHFGEHRTTQALYDAVIALYSSPATAAIGRLLLPYLFPELSDFAIVADLVTHLRTSDVRYRAAVPAEFLPTNQPPMFITLYFIVTRLPDSLRSVRDHFLTLDPTSLTIDLLEQHLLTV
ncbi:unnamed protein product, partial [Closterium sp. NIES-53]